MAVSFEPRNVTMIRKLLMDARQSLQILLIKMIKWDQNTLQFTPITRSFTSHQTECKLSSYNIQVT